MFRQLAAAIGVQRVLTEFRPSQLSEFLETFWQRERFDVRQLAFGPNVTAATHRAMARPEIIDPLGPPPEPPAPLRDPVTWHHLVYAYMLENTRMVDILRRAVHEWTTGERLPLPTERTQRWLHATEQLFFGSPWSYSVRSVTSSVRPDSGAMRRNAYYRMFGMDLNHGTDDGHVYPYPKPEIANRDFATVFEALLIELWRGYANRTTLVAENLTDDIAILTLVRRLREMLQSRRNAGTLSREEFDAIAMLSWLHLTVETDTAIVVDLNARAQGAADRLLKIGERVGIPAHARSDAYFQLAAPMSNLLLTIESNAITSAPQLYTDSIGLLNDVLTIITHWSVATGRNIKDATARQPISSVLRQLAPAAPTVNVQVSASVPAGNGAGGRIGSYVR
jgi:hypothetical protein